MKKLLYILPAFFLSLTMQAQQTEDDIFVGKTFGNYRGIASSTNNPKTLPNPDKNTTPIKGILTLTGMVVNVDWCEEDCLIIWVKKDDGTTVSVGTKDYGFSVPKEVVGKKIIIEGIDPLKPVRDRKAVKTAYQKDVQIIAIGVKVMFNNQ